ncbi:MAG: hypothetical protein AB7N80_07380 [Bdellovibrionales bacterium]
MKKMIMLAVLLGFFPLAQASRTTEIEEFYAEKVTEILKTRFPDRPFTVFVTIDTGRDEVSRREDSTRKEKTTTRLPHLEWEQDELDLWDRMDVPLGTLIGQLKSVKIDVSIDSSLTDSEVEELKTNLAKQLKLDAKADTITITKMNWLQAEKYRTFSWIALFFVVALVTTMAGFWMLAKLSVKHLVQGLSKPIQDIGQSTQKFATDALSLASDMAHGAAPTSEREKDVGAGNDNLDFGANLLEIRKNALELINRNQDLFSRPDSRLMEFLERRGQEDPGTVGSVLAELPEPTLRTLFKYGVGNWWFVALSQPGPLTSKSIQVLSEADKLRLRRHFSEDLKLGNNDDFRRAGVIFSRLRDEELAVLFADLPIEIAQSVFELMPRTLALAVAKRMFPGQWAVFLEAKKKLKPIDPPVLVHLEKQAQEMKPLRSESQIQAFFQDLDLVNYLDLASPRDEKDFYTVLPENSAIRRERVPFFKVLEAPPQVLRILGPILTVREWALVLFGCEPYDRDKFLAAFTDRLRFQVNEAFKLVDPFNLDLIATRRLRRQVTKAYQEASEREATAPTTDGGKSETVAKAA